MPICVHVWAHLCLCMCMFIIYAHVWTHTASIHMRTHVYVCVHTCSRVYVCACMDTGLLVCACTHMHVYVCMCMSTCVYVCICLFACMCMLNQSGGECSWLGFCSHGYRQHRTGFSLLWHSLALGVGLVQQREFLTVPAPLSVPGLSLQPEQLPMLSPLPFLGCWVQLACKCDGGKSISLVSLRLRLPKSLHCGWMSSVALPLFGYKGTSLPLSGDRVVSRLLPATEVLPVPWGAVAAVLLQQCQDFGPWRRRSRQVSCLRHGGHSLLLWTLLRGCLLARTTNIFFLAPAGHREGPGLGCELPAVCSNKGPYALI